MLRRAEEVDSTVWRWQQILVQEGKLLFVAIIICLISGWNVGNEARYGAVMLLDGIAVSHIPGEGETLGSRPTEGVFVGFD
jgi:hypothetical protein